MSIWRGTISGGGGLGAYPYAPNYASLPHAADHASQVYLVLQSSGIPIINYHPAGLYMSDGATWVYLGPVPDAYKDTMFRIYNATDSGKQIAFEAGIISSGQTRTITMPDRNVDLDSVGSVNSGFITNITGLIKGAAGVIAQAIGGIDYLLPGQAVVGLASSYFFSDDVIFPLTTPVWHELERKSGTGIVGSHTATTTSYTELDRYVTVAIGSTIIPEGNWQFLLYCKVSAQSGQIRAQIYRVNSSGVIVGTVLGTAESAVFNNTVAVAIPLGIYIAQQTGWALTDRIGVVLSGKKVGSPPATMTFYHDKASGWVSQMDSPVALLHNQMQGRDQADAHPTSAITGLDSALSGKQDTIGYTPENVANKVTSLSGSSTDTQYPSAKKVYDVFNRGKNCFCEVVFNGGSLLMVPMVFTKLPFNTLTGYAVTDPGSNWSAANNWYVVPVSGTYEIITKLRLNDYSAQDMSYGQGADVLAQDSAAFQWFQTLTSRNGSLNARTSNFTAGQTILMHYYQSNLKTFEDIEMFNYVSTDELTAVWAGTGVTITRETTIKQEGTASMKAVTDATNNRFVSGAVGHDYGLSPFISFYARSATAGATFRLRIKDYDDNTWICLTIFTITAANTWQEFQVNIESIDEVIDPSGGTTIEFYDLNASTTYYFDSFQQYWEYTIATAGSMNIKLIYPDVI